MPHTKGRVRHFTGLTRDLTKRQPVTAEQDRKRVIAESLRDLRGVEVVYAIRCPDGLIKIGYTSDLPARRRQLTSDPAAILAVKPGTYDEEQQVHADLRASCARGREYYHPTPEVLGYVNTIRAGYGLGPIES